MRSVALYDRGAPLFAVMIVVMVVMMLVYNLMVVVMVIIVTLAVAFAMDADTTRADIDVLRERSNRREGKRQGGGICEKVRLHLDAPRNNIRAATRSNRKPIQDYFNGWYVWFESNCLVPELIERNAMARLLIPLVGERS